MVILIERRFPFRDGRSGRSPSPWTGRRSVL